MVQECAWTMPKSVTDSRRNPNSSKQNTKLLFNEGLTTLCHFCFQELDYTNLQPLRYMILDDPPIMSACVSGNWLVTIQFGMLPIRAYRLPDLQPGKNISDNFLHSCYSARGDSDGHIYIGCYTNVSVLEINKTGDISVTRTLTAGGLLPTGRLNMLAGLGPNPEQVWVYEEDFNRFHQCIHKFYLIDTSNDTVVQMLIPNPQYLPTVHRSWSSKAAMFPTGEIFLRACADGDCVLLLYESSSTSAINLTVSGDPLLSHNNHMLLLDRESNTLLILDSEGELLHTVDDLNGKHGFQMEIWDVRFWKNNLIALSHFGGIAIFSIM